ncbi:MAG: hypothetical protein CM1200mP10_31090 [Candidatus Neomarinimicrobiota bacterium]|nr:MAG: hypothetical protein CM1200mP10_31090 [Candidatus Neomarinimicrobiota bacterium]
MPIHIPDGFFAVGYNPAMLAYQQEKPLYAAIFGFDMGLSGNFISLENLNSLSGDTLYAEGKIQGILTIIVRIDFFGSFKMLEG